MRVLFINNQVDNRGTGNALFDYALYNMLILGNESLVCSLDYTDRNALMEQRLTERFGHIYTVNDLSGAYFDVVYHIKSGHDDGVGIKGAVYGVHAVFDPSQPHGDRYATISRWMGDLHHVPYVPHIVNKGHPASWYDPMKFMEYRVVCGIPFNAKVFGRHGGSNTFDISWAFDAMRDAAKEDPNIYYLFMGTDLPDIPLDDHFIFLPETSDQYEKFMFINSCDAMIHARSRGETYGMAVGEFAVEGKTVLTYRNSPEKAHIQMLGDMAGLYSDEEELKAKILNFNPNSFHPLNSEYLEHTPQNVMVKFRQVFL